MNSETDKGNSAKSLVERPSVETRITFWDWQEASRPELRLLSEKEAIIEVGGQAIQELLAKDREELAHLLEGWRGIIQTGLDFLNATAGGSADPVVKTKGADDVE